MLTKTIAPVMRAPREWTPEEVRQVFGEELNHQLEAIRVRLNFAYVPPPMEEKCAHPADQSVSKRLAHFLFIALLRANAGAGLSVDDIAKEAKKLNLAVDVDKYGVTLIGPSPEVFEVLPPSHWATRTGHLSRTENPIVDGERRSDGI